MKTTQTREPKPQDENPPIVCAYKGTAIVRQISKEKFIIGFVVATMLVNVVAGTDEMEAVVMKVRQKFKCQVDFQWLGDR